MDAGTMSLITYQNFEQGTDAWFTARAGIVTASVVGQLVSKGSPDPLDLACERCGTLAGDPCMSTARKIPTPIKTIHDERAARAAALPPVYRPAQTDTARSLTQTLVAERITGFVEQIQPTRAMERGNLDEPYARDAYEEHYSHVEEIGFMVRDDWGYKIGYSPDGLVGDDGLIEIKSRNQRIQLATILADEVPAANMAQCQTGLLVSGRDWLDYVSYSGGMPLYVKRVHPDPAWFRAIIASVAAFESNAGALITRYQAAAAGRPTTERIEHFPEMELFV